MVQNIESLAVTASGGFLVGILIGYALKKVVKLFAIVAGLFFAGVAYLQYQQILNINWNKLQATSQNLLSNLANATAQIPAFNGLFVVGLSYLSYKGWLDVRWIVMENATKATLTNIAGQVGRALNNTTSQFTAHSTTMDALNNTTSQFTAHSTTMDAAGLPLAAVFGFMPGLMFGLKRG
jgi:uncharacterized membrane protein (Fun14 family)